MNGSTVAAATDSPGGPGDPRVTTVPAILDVALATWPDRPAVRDAAGAWTYAELGRAAAAYAGWLADRGVGRGDRVVVRLPNSRQVVALLFAVTRIGAVHVPLSPAMKDYQLRQVLADCEPALIVCPDDRTDAVRALTDVPVAGVGELPAADAAPAQAGPGAVPAADPGPVAAEPDDLAVLIYTSGSTAAPKGVMCPHAQVVFAAGSIGRVLGYRADDVVFCRPPLSFDYGLYQVFLSFLAGAELVVSSEAEPEYALLRRISEVGATVLAVVPALASMLVWLSRRDSLPLRVRMLTSTGAAFPQATIDALRKALPGARVVRMYGTTECKRITVMPPEQETERPGSSGPAIPGTRIAVVDPDGRELPAGETGEITVTGPHVMAGYWRAPEITARTFRRDPETGAVRLHTGDWGRLDADGYVYVEGRRDDMFKRKGVRMSTTEIEAAAMDIPGVRAACALQPTAERDLVICVQGDVPSGQVLRELAQRLELAKVPSACHVIEDFPFTANGKNARNVLREMIDGKPGAAGAADAAGAQAARPAGPAGTAGTEGGTR